MLRFFRLPWMLLLLPFSVSADRPSRSAAGRSIEILDGAVMRTRNHSIILEPGEDAGDSTVPGEVMVDAGSSGSKLFSFHGESSISIKVRTICTTDRTRFPLKGVSALVYDQQQCKSETNQDRKKNIKATGLPEPSFTPMLNIENDHDKPAYARRLLGLLKYMHEEQGSKLPARNRGAIPMLATAGMRLLNQRDNDAIWKNVC